MKKVFLFIIAALICGKSFSQNNFIADSLDAYINREMQRWNLPGMAVAIVKDGKVAVMKGYGVREVGKSDKVDENTLFQIASNTKAYTGTAMALLDFQKRISLDDKITKYFPEFKLYDELSTKEVTIRDMLCHRIGFRTFQSDFLNWDCNLSRMELIMNMRNVKPAYSFRSRYGYCNMGFVTAGEIIPVVTDTSWDDFLKYNIFKPLEMNRTTTHYASIISDANAAKPYTVFENKLMRVDYANIDNVGACASINSSIKDISHWIIMQLDSGRFNGKQIIPFEVIKKTRTSNMLVRDVNNPDVPSAHFSSYGLGWKLEDMHGYKIISHDGGANGFVTNTTLIPELNAGFTILTNTDANWLFVALRQQIIDALAKQPYKNFSEIYYKQFKQGADEDNARIAGLRKKAAAKPALGLPVEKCTGKYKNEMYGEMEIKNEKGKLIMYLSHHPKLKGVLAATGEKNFMCSFNDPTYGIHEFPCAIENGNIKSITVKVNDFIDYMSYDFVKM